MSKILNCLKVFKFEDLYVFSKLSFLNSIKHNYIASSIFSEICKCRRNRQSKSFFQDIKVLEKRFHSNIDAICLEIDYYKKLLKCSFSLGDGIADSINTCFVKYKSKTYKNILDNLIKPDFIRQEDEFQELLQYLIITDEFS